MPINEKTLIPLGLAILVIGGSTMWITKLEAEVDAHAKWISVRANEIELAQTRQEEILEQLAKIRVDVAEIKGQLTRKFRD